MSVGNVPGFLSCRAVFAFTAAFYALILERFQPVAFQAPREVLKLQLQFSQGRNLQFQFVVLGRNQFIFGQIARQTKLKPHISAQVDGIALQQIFLNKGHDAIELRFKKIALANHIALVRGSLNQPFHRNGLLLINPRHKDSLASLRVRNLDRFIF